jgi:selenide, water dikinase
MKPLPGARLTLISPDPTAPYTGMLPGHIAGHYPREALEIDLVRLARFAGARLILDRASAIDRERREIAVGERRIAYDLASIDIGITSDLPHIPGFSAHATAAKPLGPFAARWAEFLAREGPAAVAVIGAGVGGTELAMAMAHALRTRGRRATVTLLDRAEALPGHRAPRGPAPAGLIFRSSALNLLKRLMSPRSPPPPSGSPMAREIAADFTVAAAGARPHAWLATTGLDLHEGFVTVDRYLRSSDPAIYACGDAAHVAHAPRPKAGVYAVRAAPGPLRQPPRGSLRIGPQALRTAEGLPQAHFPRWPLSGRRAERDHRRGAACLAPQGPHRPPLHGPPRGPQADVAAEASGRGREGPPRDPAAMPLCGGCGSKVGSAALGRALAAARAVPCGRPQPSRRRRRDPPDGADDAGLTTDHLRAFTLDPWLMGRITAIHALGDIWAMGAAPQAALAQIILPPLSPALQERTLAEILDAASEIFAAEGAEIVGGHTTTGAELTLGFTVTGLADEPAPSRSRAPAPATR